MKDSTEELIGQEFEGLTVLAIGSRKSGGKSRRTARCRCKCGRECEPFLNDVLSGKTSGCGGCRNNAPRPKDNRQWAYATCRSMRLEERGFKVVNRDDGTTEFLETVRAKCAQCGHRATFRKETFDSGRATCRKCEGATVARSRAARTEKSLVAQSRATLQCLFETPPVIGDAWRTSDDPKRQVVVEVKCPHCRQPFLDELNNLIQQTQTGTTVHCGCVRGASRAIGGGQ